MNKPDNEENNAAFKLVPDAVNDFFTTVGGIARFSGRFFKEVFKPPYEINEAIKQAYYLGVNSLALVSISGFIIGMVMTLHTLPTMKQFGAEAWIPSMIAISIVREIGPILTALICAGKVGSSIGAEIGSMKVTEQIDAMAVSGTNPFNYIVVTRVLAATLMMPLLVFYADAVAIFGSFIGVNISEEVNFQLFLTKALSSLTFSDVVPATIKTFLFGFAIGIVGCYQGYQAEKGTVGVGLAANSAVVAGSLLIFILDLLVVQVAQLFI